MEKIASAIDAAASLVQLHGLLQGAVSRFGFDCFVGGRLRDGSRPADLFLSHWPGAWMGHLDEDAFDHPVVAAAIQSSASFFWDDDPARRPGERVGAFAVLEALGWRVGLVVPVHCPGGERGVVALAARRLSMTVEDRAWIETTCRLAYERGRTLKGADKSELSAREGEALALVARGHDDIEIAEALRVTKATAHAHVERAKRRLGARSRAHAVAIATARRLI